MIPWLKPTDPPEAFPPVTRALTEPDGLLCAGGDLRPERITQNRVIQRVTVGRL